MGLKYFIFKLYRKHNTRTHRLNYLFWECTQRCNLSCRHCGSDCLKSSEVPDMPAQDFIKVLDDLKANNTAKHVTVCITGGEPLLRDDLEAVGKEIVKRGFNWGIVTNGMNLSKARLYSLMNSGLTSISFSLDGLEEQHNWLRCHPQSFEKVLNSIDLVLDFQKKYPESLSFDVITCVNNHNFDFLPQIRRLLIEKGVKMWRIFSIFNEGRAAKNNLGISKEQYKQLMDFIVQTRNFKDSQGRSIHLNYSCEGYLGKYELKARDYFFMCRGGINIGSVWCDGSVSGCLSIRGKDFIQGSIYKDSFMNIWNNRFQAMRDKGWTRTGKCKSCRHWKKCLGNGIHLHHGLNTEPSFCNYEQLL